MKLIADDTKFDHVGQKCQPQWPLRGDPLKHELHEERVLLLSRPLEKRLAHSSYDHIPCGQCGLAYHVAPLLSPDFHPCPFHSLLHHNFNSYMATMAQLSFVASTINCFVLSMLLGTRPKHSYRAREKQNLIGSAHLFVPGHLIGQSAVFELGVHA